MIWGSKVARGLAALACAFLICSGVRPVQASPGMTDIFWDGPDLPSMYHKGNVHACSPGNGVAMIGAHGNNLACVTLPTNEPDDHFAVTGMPDTGMATCEPGSYMIGMVKATVIACAHNPSIQLGASVPEHGKFNTRYIDSHGNYISAHVCNEIDGGRIMVLTGLSRDGKRMLCAPVKWSHMHF